MQREKKVEIEIQLGGWIFVLSIYTSPTQGNTLCLLSLCVVDLCISLCHLFSICIDIYFYYVKKKINVLSCFLSVLFSL